MRSSKHTTKMILVAFVTSLLNPPVQAFRSSVAKTSVSSVAPFPNRSERHPLSTVHPVIVEKSDTKQRTYKYNLGIGKNKPVTSSSNCDELQQRINSIDPTRFLVEHESTRIYPSPLKTEQPKAKAENQEMKPKKKLPKVEHKRHSEDVLFIQDPTGSGDDGKTNFHLPFIMSVNRSSNDNVTRDVKLDLNTVWVEMMLHDERAKLISK